jgi:hypothetical protein
MAAPLVAFPPCGGDDRAGPAGTDGQPFMKTDALTHAGMDGSRESAFREGVVAGGNCRRGRRASAFPSRSFAVSAGNGASRTCVAVAPRSLLISHHKGLRPAGLGARELQCTGISRDWLRGECTCRVNGILIMFPLACSIRTGGRFGRRNDGQAEFSQGWGLIAGPQTPMRQAESTGAKE